MLCHCYQVFSATLWFFQAQSTKWAQYVEKEDEDEDAGDADPVYTTDRSAFDQARKDNRKIQRKSYQRYVFQI